MGKNIILLAFALVLTPVAFAQRTFTSAPADSSAANKQTPILITDSNAGEYFGSNSGNSTVKPPQKLHTSLKINPLLVISGDMPVYLEHRIGERLTAEISLGVTYNNVLTDWVDSEYYPEQLAKQNEMGYSYSAAVRYYPSRSYETMEGYYFTPEYRHRVYNATATSLMDSPISVNQSRNVSEGRLLFGYTDFFEDHIFIDVFAGIGMRTNQYRNMISDEGSIFNSQTMEVAQKYSTYNPSRTSPVFALGFKVGFAF
jgi:hypothetical protein